MGPALAVPLIFSVGAIGTAAVVSSGMNSSAKIMANQVNNTTTQLNQTANDAINTLKGSVQQMQETLVVSGNNVSAGARSFGLDTIRSPEFAAVALAASDRISKHLDKFKDSISNIGLNKVTIDKIDDIMRQISNVSKDLTSTANSVTDKFTGTINDSTEVISKRIEDILVQLDHFNTTAGQLGRDGILISENLMKGSEAIGIQAITKFVEASDKIVGFMAMFLTIFTLLYFFVFIFASILISSSHLNPKDVPEKLIPWACSIGMVMFSLISHLKILPYILSENGLGKYVEYQLPKWSVLSHP